MTDKEMTYKGLRMVRIDRAHGKFYAVVAYHNARATVEICSDDREPLDSDVHAALDSFLDSAQKHPDWYGMQV